jgi:GNAT superfamily N-acetyltransferase
MLPTFFIADKTRHSNQIREIFWEYLQWVNPRIFQEYGVDFDIQTLLEHDMLDLDKFMPPPGRLLLGYPEDRPGGIACLKTLDEGIGEIKRMYVRPEYRRQGLGRSLLQGILHEVSLLGYQTIRLDSARFMQDAHRLYRAFGFIDIASYAGSEIPVDYQKNWVFMEKKLPAELNIEGDYST